MMKLGMIAIVGFAMSYGVLPANAGDASGFDPATIDQCVTSGEGDCTDAGMQACRDYASKKYTGDDPDFVEKNCLDAAHQAWEARLEETYQALIAQEGEAGDDSQEMLRKTEHAWIAFRDSLCDYAKASAQTRDDSGEVALLECQRDEAARHWTLLNARLVEETGE